MFGKKNNKNKADTIQQSTVSATPQKQTKVKKKKTGIATIFRESVLETVMTDFRDNEQFIHKEDGVDKYVGILLDTHDIGGLDKKSKKVEAKGQLIECINSGRIKTMITEDLMDEECIVFVPEVFTLHAMDEFSMLTNTQYELCYVEPNGDIELLGKKITYKEVTDILVNEGHIDDILGYESDEPEDSGEPDELLDDTSTSNDTFDNANDYDNLDMDDDDIDMDDDDIDMDDDDVPSIDDYDNVDDSIDNIDDSTSMQDGISSQVYVPPYTTEQNVTQESTVDTNGQMDGSMDNQMNAGPEPENEIPVEWSNEVLTRKFYSDDLGLEITTEPFDVQFLQGNVFLPFEEHRPHTWLNDALNEMSRQANDEMSRMHQENIFIMRERYFRLMSIYCDKIRKDLDANDTSTIYGQLKQQLEEEHHANLQSMGAQVSAQKEELENAWRQRLQEIGMDAAREAQHKYRERYQSAHEKKIFEIEAAVKANIHAEFQYGIHELNERRRCEASSLLDLGISETLAELSEMYTSALEEERVRYQELTENLREFQNSYLQEDILKTSVLQEELRQTEKADTVLAEQTVKMRALTDEYTVKRKELQDEIDRLRKENKDRLATMKQDCEQDVARIRSDKESLQQQYDKLLDKYNSLDEKKDEEYKARMSELKDELEAWSEKYDYIVDVHKNNNRIATFCVIAAVIAAIAIGFIGGEFANSKRNVKQQLQSIQQQQQIDVLE